MVAVALATLLLRGPEPLSGPDYAARVTTAYADVQKAFGATRGASGDALAARVGAAQAELRSAADTLDSLRPPADAEHANAELAAGMRGYADDLDELRAAAERDDAAAQERFNRGVAANASVRRLAAAARELELLGYEVEGLAED